LQIRTTVLSHDRLLKEANRLPGYLIALGTEKVVVSYGWGSGIHEDLWYLPMQVKIAHLRLFLADSISQRIYLPGDSDLLIEDEPNTWSVRLCHESDIHLESDREDVVDYFVQAWADLIP
jgi:hypothetical protein